MFLRFAARLVAEGRQAGSAEIDVAPQSNEEAGVLPAARHREMTSAAFCTVEQKKTPKRKPKAKASKEMSER